MADLSAEQFIYKNPMAQALKNVQDIKTVSLPALNHKNEYTYLLYLFGEWDD